ncbi:MAG: hypothetical protein J6B90_02100 [Lachnospiraceae bacterium]|nr:hypothetical protein [Lachnospiraceae bacterium]
MRKLLGSILVIIMVTMLTGCGAEKLKEKEKENEDIKYSENILLSLNNGAPGYGTRAECIDAEIFIYTDRTVKVIVYYPEELEIASLELSEADYERVLTIADPEEISSLKTEEDREVCDGSSYHITLYDEQDEEVLSLGGYMPEGKKFWEIYGGIKEILEPYGIHESVVAYRESVE